MTPILNIAAYKFLPLCDPHIEGMAKAIAKSKATYRNNFSNPAVRKLLQGKERA